MIIGESGTGKDLVARALHTRSRRHAGPFIPVHTGAVPKDLVANELFGHEKGAFTGAHGASEGKFAAAEGGTLFLDEVGTMDLATQICLLRVLETHRYTRVGSNKEEKADVRIVAATNSDLLDLVEQKLFREDLFYRLNVLTIALPPLRERKEDIVAIAERFLKLAAKRYGLPPKTLSPEAGEALLEHHWPGNIRELRNSMDQVAVLAQGETVAADEIDFAPARIAVFQGSELASVPAASLAAPSAPESEPEEAPSTGPSGSCAGRRKGPSHGRSRGHWCHDGRGRAPPHLENTESRFWKQAARSSHLGHQPPRLVRATRRLRRLRGHAGRIARRLTLWHDNRSTRSVRRTCPGTWAYATHEESDERKRE